jgi:IS1 family transposase
MLISSEQYNRVYNLINEGNSLSGTGRLLSISASSVQRIIKRISSKLSKPVFKEKGECYEIDELCTFSRYKENRIWIIYIINRKTQKIIDFFVGARTKANINKVLESVLSLSPKYIYTDKLNIYASLIPENRHRFYNRCTNHIERLNLTLRTWLKRLSRKTICFTRSEDMLNHCVKLLVNKINTIKN